MVPDKIVDVQASNQKLSITSRDQLSTNHSSDRREGQLFWRVRYTSGHTHLTYNLQSVGSTVYNYCQISGVADHCVKHRQHHTNSVLLSYCAPNSHYHILFYKTIQIKNFNTRKAISLTEF